jgi:hypothetical protein
MAKKRWKEIHKNVHVGALLYLSGVSLFSKFFDDLALTFIMEV